jgi:CheY-like chemotaxis protein
MENHTSILLIDDDEDDRALFFEAVNEVDKTIDCTGVENGHEALAYLKNLANPLPDYIFLDLRMPGLSGEQCLIEMKKDPRLFPVPVIVYTTSRELNESIGLKKLGAAHFMSKPTSPDEVYFMVSFVLGEKWT